MKLTLSVRDAGTTDARTLYYYDLPNLEALLPEDTWVSVAYGEDPDEHGVSMYVARSYLDMTRQQFVAQLQEVWVDPPEHWGSVPRNVMAWRTDIDCPSEQFHENLRAGGWKEH